MSVMEALRNVAPEEGQHRCVPQSHSPPKDAITKFFFLSAEQKCRMMCFSELSTSSCPLGWVRGHHKSYEGIGIV